MQQARHTPEESWYQLGRTLEAGVTGEVFEAEHPQLTAPCAVKILRTDLTDRTDSLPLFRQDVETVAALRHPNILQVLEVGSTPDVPAFVVTELLDGRSLADRLGTRARLPLARAVEVVDQIAAGLQAAHHVGVVHGELNPRNVLLAWVEGHEHGVAKLLDFGIVRLRTLDAIASLPVETIRYLSPEQAAGRTDDVDARSDQFSLAVIAYRMLAGRDAFEGDSAVSLLYQMVHGQPGPAPIAEGGPAVEAVIRRALAKDRRHRFESVADFARALAEAAGEQRPPTPAPQVVPVAPPPAEVVLAAPVWAAPPPPVVAQPQVVTAQPQVLVAQPQMVAAQPQVLVVAAQPASLARFDDGSDLFTHPFFEPGQPTRRSRRRVRIIYRRRRSRAPLLLLVVGAGIAWLMGALSMGWRPPLAWRQSPLWHELGLPYGE